MRPFGLPAERRSAAAGIRLARAGDAIDTVFVPLDAIVLMARQTPLDRVPLTVSLIGGEGLVGCAALLDTPTWSHDAIVVGGGTLMAISAGDLLAACAAQPELHRLLLRVVNNHMLQLTQSVVANLGHSVERRLSRWLAMLDDRSVSDVLSVTHDQLALLLNVRRATITDALHLLEGERLIRNTRGRIQVRDRAGLELRAGQSYGFSEGDYVRTIGPFGKGSTAAT